MLISDAVLNISSHVVHYLRPDTCYKQIYRSKRYHIAIHHSLETTRQRTIRRSFFPPHISVQELFIYRSYSSCGCRDGYEEFPPPHCPISHTLPPWSYLPYPPHFPSHPVKNLNPKHQSHGNEIPVIVLSNKSHSNNSIKLTKLCLGSRICSSIQAQVLSIHEHQ